MKELICCKRSIKLTSLQVSSKNDKEKRRQHLQEWKKYIITDLQISKGYKFDNLGEMDKFLKKKETVTTHNMI